MIKYLKNPYILIGLGGIAFWLYSRKNIVKSKANTVSKQIKELKDNSEIPEDFKKDVDTMTTEEIVSTIEHNVRMLDRADIKDKSKKLEMERMLEYLTDEYDKRISKK
jgi:hypothetical protein